MKLHFLKRAEKHLDDIYDFLKLKSEDAAVDVYNEILDEIERLKSFPEMAPIETNLIDFPEIFRALVIRKTYKVIYYIKNDRICISAVWDCRQNPNKLKSKLKKN
jgi:plasmid stabilization system protein ParE